MARRRRVVLVTAAVLTGLMGGACDVHAEVAVRLERDGTGSVTVVIELDEAAVERSARIGAGPLEDAYPIDDLVAAGWTTAGWVEAVDGASITFTRNFTSPDQLPELLDQLSGDSGVVRGVVAVVERDGFRESEELALTVDLTSVRAGVTDDEELAAALADLGVAPDTVELLLTAELADALDVTAEVSTGEVTDSATVTFGGVATVSVEDDRVDTERIVVAAAAAAIGVVGVALLLVVLITGVRSRRRAG